MNKSLVLRSVTGVETSGAIRRPSFGDQLDYLGSFKPGALVGGAVAGGLLTLLAHSESARQFASAAAAVGGTVILGGLAYKAYRKWKQNRESIIQLTERNFTVKEVHTDEFHITLIKAMIAAARADNHIEEVEYQRLLAILNNMDLSTEVKALVFDLLRRPITVDELTHGITTIEQKTEIYLLSYLIIDENSIRLVDEKNHLRKLARALQLPPGLVQALEQQARHDFSASRFSQ